MNYKQKEKARNLLITKRDALDNVTHVLEATANVYYSPDDTMWNVLLKARDSVSKHIDKETIAIHKEMDKLDADYKAQKG